MEIVQYKWVNNDWVKQSQNNKNSFVPTLCLIFGSRKTIELNGEKAVNALQSKYVSVQVVTCSTAGNIIDESLLDDTLVATCIEFKSSKIEINAYDLGSLPAHELGIKIAADFNDIPNVKYLLLLSTTGINTESLLNGINEKLNKHIQVSGGVAGDNVEFQKTLVGLNNTIKENQIIVTAFIGETLSIKHGSSGGWDSFGPERVITKANGNILYEIDNKPVLNLYKDYTGKDSQELRSQALLFPFTVINENSNEPIVRGVQDIDEKNNSLILFGDVIEGQKIQLMRANFDKIISASGDSAVQASNETGEVDLAILISCVARRIVLGQMIEEELVEAKINLASPNAAICGFYSYSELSPLVGSQACLLHNQTMTITTITEK